MCGLCGVIDRSGAGHRELVGDMARTLVHRGPDETAVTELVPLAASGLAATFGHTRLRIVDLSSAAAQPMTGAGGRLALTYNGEVYNHRALAAELAALGLPVRSSGDTEVVLRAYEAWGPAFVERLEGMFALALWDDERGHVLLARDRSGKKPLFYAARGDCVVFASELKAVLRAPWLSSEPDPAALAAYLERGYVSAPATIARDVRQVMPAHTLLITADGPGAQRRYWRPPVHPRRPDGPGLRAEVRSALDDAVRSRLHADVPVGALLSGGVDSSVVVALAARHSADPVRTFSVGFPDDPSFDERHHAKVVADHVGTLHEELAVRIDAVGLLDEVLWHLDEPSGDSSAIPTYLAFGLAGREARVVLTGDGGDETFGGYDRFTAARIAGYVPRPAGRLLHSASRRLRAGSGYFDAARRLQRFFEAPDHPLTERYVRWTSVLDPERLRSVAAPAVAAHAAPPGRLMAGEDADVAALGDLDRIVYADFLTYLPGDLHVKVDRMSMAHSVEARSPFLDTRVVELLSRVPAVDRVGLRRPKPLLRAACRDLLPDTVWNRPKHGFGVPVGSWLRGDLGQVFEDEVLAGDARSAPFLDRRGLEALWTEHRSGDAEHGHRLWALLTLERWLRTAGTRRAAPAAAAVSGLMRARHWELVRYGTVGLLNAGCYFGLYSAGVLAGLPYLVAAPLAFLTSAVIGYWLHEHWTFGGRNPSLRALAAWLAAQVGTVSLSLALLWLLVEAVGLGPILAQALLLPLGPALAYLVSRTWIFTRA